MRKRRKKKSQMALELTLLMSLAMLLLLPSMVLFSNFIQESGKEIVETQVKQIGTSMIEQIQSMFYYGDGSMIIVEYTFPEKVKSMKINADESVDIKYYELAFELDLPGDISKAYVSKIPIAAATEDGNMIIDGKFPEISYMKGKKKFRIQNAANKIIITYLEPKN